MEGKQRHAEEQGACCKTSDSQAPADDARTHEQPAPWCLADPSTAWHHSQTQARHSNPLGCIGSATGAAKGRVSYARWCALPSAAYSLQPSRSWSWHACLFIAPGRVAVAVALQAVLSLARELLPRGIQAWNLRATSGQSVPHARCHADCSPLSLQARSTSCHRASFRRVQRATARCAAAASRPLPRSSPWRTAKLLLRSLA